jgi:hypothetical protein
MRTPFRDCVLLVRRLCKGQREARVRHRQERTLVSGNVGTSDMSSRAQVYGAGARGSWTLPTDSEELLWSKASL